MGTEYSKTIGCIGTKTFSADIFQTFVQFSSCFATSWGDIRIEKLKIEQKSTKIYKICHVWL